MLLGPPDRRLIVTFQAEGLRICLLLVPVVYQATVPVNGIVVRVAHKSRTPGRLGCKLLYGGP